MAKVIADHRSPALHNAHQRSPLRRAEKNSLVFKHLVQAVGGTAVEVIHSETKGKIRMFLKEPGDFTDFLLKPWPYKKIIELLPAAHETTLIRH